jgi:hypothetical protein
MTRADIKAELRRSACEDFDPWDGVGYEAFCMASNLSSGYLSRRTPPPILRIFFLLVAEAI